MSLYSSKCPVCGSNASLQRQGFDYLFVECPTCGRYEIEDMFFYPDSISPKDYDELASYFYYNGKINPPIGDYRFFNFVGNKEKFAAIKQKCSWAYHVTKDILHNWYPKTFSEKVDMFLLGLGSKATYMGEIIELTDDETRSACFVQRKRNADGEIVKTHDVDDQVAFFLDYLVKQEYIEASLSRFTILPKGLQRIDELQRDRAKQTKNVFVAMSFSEIMIPVREAIKSALLECGYIPRIMDEVEHNNQIVPEMLYEIREAKFTVAELTGHNNGAYLEAGYAMGCGKEVILLCKKEQFEEDGHFDVKQANTILWETPEDLTKRLVARIRATIA